jgi:preprotein translocase subunit SecB
MKPKINPEEYRDILSCLELKTLYLVHLETDLNEDSLDKELSLHFKDKISFSQENSILSIYYGYTLSAGKDEKSKSTFDITAKYKIIYQISNDKIVTNEFMDVFNHVTLEFLVWPFFRELIHNLISRMNLPPLVLPLRKAIQK